MENYKVIIVKLARPDVTNGVKMFARLMGIPETKSQNLVSMMPFVLFEVKNFAIARKLKALLAPMEAYGFPILISLESGPISKVNWPKGVKLNGMVVEDIVNSVPEFVNLMNQCPSCGLEIRYQVSLRIENESVKFPLGSDLKVEETRTQTLEPDSEVEDLVEMDVIEELTDLDETDGSLPATNGGFVAQAVEAEEIDSDVAADLFEEAEPVGVSYGKLASNEIEFEAVGASGSSDFGVVEAYDESDSQLFGGEYSLAVGVINSLNDRIRAARVLSEILGIPESDALLKVKKTGDVIIQNVTLDEAKSFKKLFDQKNLNVKIIN